MTVVQDIRLRPAPLPPSLTGISRLVKTGPSLNDLVENIFRVLYDGNEEFHEYMEAVYDADAQEGSLAADNHCAAEMIRNQAKKDGLTHLGEKKLAVIVNALGVVTRRWGLDRKTRRNTVSGQIIPSNGD